MNEIVIDRKKYVLLSKKEYKTLQRKAALSIKPEKLLTVAEARNYSNKLIRQWAGEE